MKDLKDLIEKFFISVGVFTCTVIVAIVLGFYLVGLL